MMRNEYRPIAFPTQKFYKSTASTFGGNNSFSVLKIIISPHTRISNAKQNNFLGLIHRKIALKWWNGHTKLTTPAKSYALVLRAYKTPSLIPNVHHDNSEDANSCSAWARAAPYPCFKSCEHAFFPSLSSFLVRTVPVHVVRTIVRTVRMKSRNNIFLKMVKREET